MKQYVLGFAAALLLAGVATQAGAATVSNYPSEGRRVYHRQTNWSADQMTRQMVNRLGLTSEQEKKVARLNSRYEDDLNKGGIADSYNGYIGKFSVKDRAKLRKKAQKRRDRLEKREDKLQDVLSSSQWRLYKQAKRRGSVWAR